MSAKILFSAKDATHGTELWVTDGSTASYIDVYPGSGSSYPLYITSLGNGKALFSAATATSTGKELFVTDGTPGGTKLVTDINTSTGSYPGGNMKAGIVALGNGSAVFTADDGSSYQTDLWVSNGTAGGTVMLTGRDTGFVPTYPTDITALGNGKALFGAQDSAAQYGNELWVTDGTNAGTYRLSNSFYGFAGSYPQNITAIGNGKALFSANDAPTVGHKYGYELFITDGTTAGTALVKDIDPGTDGSNPHGFAVLGSNVLFAANNGTAGDELYITDGTQTGTTLVKDINPGTGNSDPTDITALGNGKAVFAADDGTHGTELWITDGTNGGTSLVADINTLTSDAASSPSGITALGNGKAVFSANDGINGTELWVTDGTLTGTYMLADLNYAINSSTPLYITAIGGDEAVFRATYAKDFTHKYGAELFITDGTKSGTKLVSDIYPGSTGSGPQGFAVVEPVCFCRGTMILTERGEVPVEELAIGDRVKTLAGTLKPVVWIGMGRDLVTRANKLARPVIVRRGALADNVPQRDLYLTHGHALYLHDVLIPVENLINHRSILWDDAARVVEFYHLELEDHDVVLADGAPAESYYDAGNRAQFQNTRPGSAAGTAKPTFAPVLNGGDIVEQVWAALSARAGAQVDGDTTEDHDLHLVVDGFRNEAISAEAGAYTFALAAPPRDELRLRSDSGVPSLLGVTRHDHRQLGVAIIRIELHAAGVTTVLHHEAALFTEGGCHPAEAQHRWTDGDSELPARLFAHLSGPCTLTVHTQRTGMRYPIATSVAQAA